MKQQIDYSELSKEALASRLSTLLGTERRILVEFLQHLSEFDRREAYLEMGYGSLFDYCVKKLHLSKGSAYRRSIGSKLISTFPQIADYLADGRICLSTLVVLNKCLNAENVDTILAQAIYKTKEEAEIIVARYSAPVALPRKESVRKVSSPKVVVLEVCKKEEEVQVSDLSSAAQTDKTQPTVTTTVGHEGKDRSAIDGEKVICAFVSRQKPDEIKAISEDLRVLKVTVSKEFIEELKHIRELLSHKVRDGNFEDVLREGFKLIRQKYERSLAKEDLEESGKPMDREQSTAHINADKKQHPQDLAEQGSAPEERSSCAVTSCISPSGSEPETWFPGKPHAQIKTQTALRFAGHDQATMCEQSEHGSAGIHRKIRSHARYIPRSVKRKVWRKSNESCTYQGKDFTKCQSKWQLEFEHIIPVAKGASPRLTMLLCSANATISCGPGKNLETSA